MIKTTRSAFSLLLVLAMMLSLIGAGVYADNYTGIKVAGTDIATDTFYRAAGNGVEAYPDNYASEDSYLYLSSSGVLTLHNFNLYSATAVNGQDDTFAGLYIPESCSWLQLSLEGNSSLSFDSYSAVFGEDGSVSGCCSYGIKAPGTDLNICGYGNLSVNSLDMGGYGAAESIAVYARSITLSGAVSLNAAAGAVDDGYSCGVCSGSVVLTDVSSSVTANAGMSAFNSIPACGVEGYELSVSSDWNQGLTGSGSATVYLSETVSIPEPESEPEPAYESEPEAIPEPVADTRVPAVMPDLSGFYVSGCTNENNNDGFMVFPEGYIYEWKAEWEENYKTADGNGLSGLVPGIYLVRLAETAEALASEPYYFEISAYTAPEPEVGPISEPVYESEPEVIPEPVADTRVPAVMPDLSGFYVSNCTNENNNDGYMVFPEGYTYEWRVEWENDYKKAEVNGISGLVPGVYLVRLAETSEYLASEPYYLEVSAYTAPEPEPEPVPEPSPEQTQEPVTEIIEEPAAAAVPEPSAEPSPEPTPELKADFTAPVLFAAPEEPLKIDASIALDSGEAPKAADTTQTEETTEELPREVIPSDITFEAVNDTTGKLMGNGLHEGLKYRLGTMTGDYLPLTVKDGRATISGLGDGSMISIITPGDGTTTQDSLPLNIQVNVSETPLESQFTITACTTLNQNDGTITVPAGNTYEFSEHGQKKYTLIEGSTDSAVTVTGLPSGYYDLRVRAAGTYLASGSVTVRVEEYVAPDVRPAPDVYFNAEDGDSGYLYGTDTTMEFKIESQNDWTPVKGTSLHFTGLSKGLVIQVRYSATASEVASAIKEIVLDRQPTPSGDFISVTDCTTAANNDGTIILLCDNYSDYEIRYGGSGDFTQIQAKKITGLVDGTYYIRARASGTKLASKLCSVIVDEYIPASGIACQAISMLPYEKIFDTTDGYSTLTVTFYPVNTTNQTVTFTSSNTSVINFGSQSTTTVGTNGTATIRMYPVGSGEATITATTSNGMTATCHATVAFEYRFTYNKSGTWYYDRGGDYTVQTNGPMSRFSALKINGQVVNPQYYTTRANTDGTTILTITQYAMSCLNHGAYQRIQLVYNDGGTATTFLHIMSVHDKPITGDNSSVALWALLGTVSLAALTVIAVKSRKRRSHAQE